MWLTSYCEYRRAIDSDGEPRHGLFDPLGGALNPAIINDFGAGDLRARLLSGDHEGWLSLVRDF